MTTVVVGVGGPLSDGYTGTVVGVVKELAQDPSRVNPLLLVSRVDSCFHVRRHVLYLRQHCA